MPCRRPHAILFQYKFISHKRLPSWWPPRAYAHKKRPRLCMIQISVCRWRGAWYAWKACRKNTSQLNNTSDVRFFSQAISSAISLYLMHPYIRNSKMYHICIEHICTHTHTHTHNTDITPTSKCARPYTPSVSDV